MHLLQDHCKVIKVARSDLKRIESFLVGDSGPDVFYNIQSEVLATLEEEHYPAFLVSETCYKMLEDAQENGITLCEVKGGGGLTTNSSIKSNPLMNFMTSFDGDVQKGNGGSANAVTTQVQYSNPSMVWKDMSSEMDTSCTNAYNNGISHSGETLLVSEHSSFAKSHLEYIGERLQNKMQALKALKSSLKPDSKVSKTNNVFELISKSQYEK